MGVGALEARLLAHFFQAAGPQSSALTLGRQGITFRDDAWVRRLLEESGASELSNFLWLDEALVSLGLTQVCESLDVSPYEGASIVCDLADVNALSTVARRFDVVIDFGTSEHVSNIHASIRNAFSLVRDGGYLILSVPSDGFCGHGYWQVSPAALFDLLEDGRASHVVAYFTSPAAPAVGWLPVRNPRMESGMRNRPPRPPRFPTYLVAVVKKCAELSNAMVFQADYLDAWGTPSNVAAGQKPKDVPQESFHTLATANVTGAAFSQRLRLSLRNLLWLLLPQGIVNRLYRNRPKT